MGASIYVGSLPVFLCIYTEREREFSLSVRASMWEQVYMWEAFLSSCVYTEIEVSLSV